jgi:hypothetical protein
MIVAFARENSLAVIVGEETVGRLQPPPQRSGMATA